MSTIETTSTMNNVITLKEITDLIEVRHNDAMRKVEDLAKEPDFGSLRKTRIQYLSGKNTVQEMETYSFTKIQAIAVGARLNNSLLMKVIKRLEELETPKPLAKMPTHLETAKLLVESLTLNETLKSTLLEKDKVILAVADLNIKAGEVTIGDFSKNLAIENLGRNNLFSWLKARGFLMTNTEPYQQYVARGYFTRRPCDKRINGEVKYTTMLTPKGTIWLTKMLNAEYDLNIEVK